MIILTGGATPQVYRPTRWVSRIYSATLLVSVQAGRVRIDGNDVGVAEQGYQYPLSITGRAIVVSTPRGQAHDDTYVLFDTLLPVFYEGDKGVDRRPSELLSWARRGNGPPQVLIRAKGKSLVSHKRTRGNDDGDLATQGIRTHVTLEGITVRQSFGNHRWGPSYLPGMNAETPYIEASSMGTPSFEPSLHTAPIVWRCYNADHVFEGMLLDAEFAFHDVRDFSTEGIEAISTGYWLIPGARPHARDMSRFPHLRQLHEGLTAPQWGKMIEVLRYQYPQEAFAEAVSENSLMPGVADRVKELIRGSRHKRRSGMFHGVPGAIIGVRRKGRQMRAKWEFETSTGKVFVVDSDEQTIGACYVFLEEDEATADAFFEFRTPAGTARERASGRFEHRGYVTQWLRPIVEHLATCGVDVSSATVPVSS